MRLQLCLTKKKSPFAKDIFQKHAQEPAQEQVIVHEKKVDLKDVDDLLPDVSYRSYLPCKPLTYQPTNCIATHPDNPRYCRVSVPRYMYQVEKKKRG